MDSSSDLQHYKTFAVFYGIYYILEKIYPSKIGKKNDKNTVDEACGEGKVGEEM